MKSIYLALVLVGLLLAGCTTPQEQAPVNESGTNHTMNDTAPDMNETTVMPPAEKDCGTDMNCFISEAENCSKAKMNYSVAVNFLETVMNTTSFMQIKGMEEEKCLFYIRTDEIDVYYNENLTQKLLGEGKTMEEIEDMEKNASMAASSVDSKFNELCKFNSSENLAAMLKEWKSGRFSTSDYEDAECEEMQ